MNTKKQDDPVERIPEDDAMALMTKLRQRFEGMFEDESNGRSEAEVLAFLESLVRRSET